MKFSPLLAQALNFDFNPLSQFLKSTWDGFLALIKPIFQGLYDFFVAFLNWFSNTIAGFLTATLNVLPDPPFKLWSAFTNLTSGFPDVPWRLFAPQMTIIAGLLVVRLSIGSIRFLIKGWL